MTLQVTSSNLFAPLEHPRSKPRLSENPGESRILSIESVVDKNRDPYNGFDCNPHMGVSKNRGT